MENLIGELKKIYTDTNFYKSDRDGHSVLIYDNQNLEWDEEFIAKVIELAERNLCGKELDNFTFLYDYLGEISSNDTEEVFGVDYIKSKQSKIIEKRVELFDFGTVEININIKNKRISKAFEKLNFKSKEKSDIFTIASTF
ncbi:conserved hypothetical protein [Clostridium neonatale]|uniref:Uncharacterized protein n=1 Tax=Clostridium carnis TaxID=1530 RepID=A0ABY6SQU4_9CLOT|nr:hypothetical protein [Clostridium carnis]CAI3544233.1 conserved hypothetical protein [Clostridium neonatale]CAI3546825.1 conserved hypothetical protein [Clostridium neonatale]CAI3625213.1 conserved hypothetical protein [Clostridium neonatale]CAI3625299.1 conserved hypothetical protein [Clostridium neonatale]CAI3628683.1 conserved hypothetical protein [Clostridium neonatale]